MSTVDVAMWSWNMAMPMANYRSLSSRNPYCCCDIVLGFLVQCTVAALESFVLLFTFYFKVSSEPQLIVTEHFHSLLGNTQILAETDVRIQ